MARELGWVHPDNDRLSFASGVADRMKEQPAACGRTPECIAARRPAAATVRFTDSAGSIWSGNARGIAARLNWTSSIESMASLHQSGGPIDYGTFYAHNCAAPSENSCKAPPALAV